MFSGEFLKSLIKGKHERWRLACSDIVQREILPLSITAGLDSRLSPRFVNEHASHRLGGGGKEMATAIPMPRLVAINEAKIRFMHQSGRL